jgi:hypothetical protein
VDEGAMGEKRGACGGGAAMDGWRYDGGGACGGGGRRGAMKEEEEEKD